MVPANIHRLQRSWTVIRIGSSQYMRLRLQVFANLARSGLASACQGR